MKIEEGTILNLKGNKTIYLFKETLKYEIETLEDKLELKISEIFENGGIIIIVDENERYSKNCIFF